jgi:hypothetical protein
MKTIKLSILAVLLCSVSFAQKTKSKKAQTVVTTEVVKVVASSELKWNEDIHNFGDIEQSKPVSFDFTFTNTTKEVILLTNVKPSCGCTAANYTKTPIKPGEKGVVTATFDANTPNSFMKTVTVTTNSTDVTPKILTIKGNVLVPTSKS